VTPPARIHTRVRWLSRHQGQLDGMETRPLFIRVKSQASVSVLGVSGQTEIVACIGRGPSVVFAAPVYINNETLAGGVSVLPTPSLKPICKTKVSVVTKCHRFVVLSKAVLDRLTRSCLVSFFAF
jgi:hypothetical protein